MYPNTLPLDGPGQYILTSVTLLITSNQAAYLNRVEELLRKGKNIDETDLSDEGRNRMRRTYRCMFAGWWILTIAAVVCAIRVGLYHFMQSFWWLDFVIVSTLIIGYLALMMAGYRSWNWNPEKRVPAQSGLQLGTETELVVEKDLQMQFAPIKSDLLFLKWMTGIVLGGIIAFRK